MSSRKLSQCAACGGFVPASASSCPHCFKGAKSSTFNRLKLRALGGAFGGGAIAFTLMACYGAPPCDEPSCRVDNNSDGGEATDEGGGRDVVNRPDVIVTPKNDGGGQSEAGSDAAADAGDGG